MSDNATLHFFFYEKQKFTFIYFRLKFTNHSQTNVLVFVLSLINLIGYLFIDMTIKKCFKNTILLMSFKSNFNFLFFGDHKFVFFTNHRITIIITYISSIPDRIKTTIFIIPNVSSSSFKKCLSNLVCILQR